MANVDEFIEKYQSSAHKPKLLVIKSAGGDILAGIKLGRWVYQNQLDVKVNKYCLSSCANYVFPAGKNKILTQYALLAWHGGGQSKSLQNMAAFDKKMAKLFIKNNITDQQKQSELYQQQLQIREKLLKEEAQFYQDIGVNPVITTIGGYYPDKEKTDLVRYSKKTRPKDMLKYQGFYYTLADMKKLGVNGISLADGSWQPELNKNADDFFLVDLTRYWQK